MTVPSAPDTMRSVVPRRAHPTNHSGEIVIDWPISHMPDVLAHSSTISIEVLEDEIEREARREERSPG